MHITLEHCSIGGCAKFAQDDGARHLHFSRMHRVIFNTRNDPLIILNRGQVQRTKLTKFFRMCATDENARQLTYQEFPQHYV